MVQTSALLLVQTDKRATAGTHKREAVGAILLVRTSDGMGWQKGGGKKQACAKMQPMCPCPRYMRPCVRTWCARCAWVPLAYNK